MVTRISLIILLSGLCSCNKLDIKGLLMPTGDGVDKRFEQSMEINEGLKARSIEAHMEYTFYVATDPHVDDTHTNLERFNDTFRNDADASFCVILGDCIDVKDNLPKYLEALAYDSDRHSFDHSIYHVLGNHDTYFNGWLNFRELVGPSVYWFEVIFDGGGKDLYVSLDTATGSLGRKQTEWLKSLLATNRNDYRHCVIFTHTNFFYTDNSQAGSGNMPIEESFALMDFFGRHDVSLVLQGHDHYREDLTYANVRYTVLGAIHDGIENPEYLKINVDNEGINLEWQYIK